MAIVEYGTIEIEPTCELNIFYDAAGVAYLKCRSLHKLGLNTNLAYKYNDGKLAPTPDGRQTAAVSRLDVIETELYPKLRVGKAHQ